MRTSCAIMFFTLLDASSAHAGSVLGALINGSGARFTVKNCGTDTCGTIAWGKQKFVVRRSDVPSIFKVPSERDKATVVVDRRSRPKPLHPPRPKTAPLRRGGAGRRLPSDRTSVPGRPAKRSQASRRNQTTRP
jgi:hypothetical protein